MGGFAKGFAKTARVIPQPHPASLFARGNGRDAAKLQLSVNKAKVPAKMDTAGIGTFASDATGGGIAGGYT